MIQKVVLHSPSKEFCPEVIDFQAGRYVLSEELVVRFTFLLGVSIRISPCLFLKHISDWVRLMISDIGKSLSSNALPIFRKMIVLKMSLNIFPQTVSTVHLERGRSPIYSFLVLITPSVSGSINLFVNKYRMVNPRVIPVHLHMYQRLPKYC